MMLEIEVNLDGIRFCGDDDEHLELHNCRIVPTEYVPGKTTYYGTAFSPC